MLRDFRWPVVLFTLIVIFARPAPSQNADQSNTYKLAGAVINSVTGKPIPRVLVKLAGPPPEQAVLTGPEGDFAFENVPAGMTQISINKPGFFRPGTATNANLPIPVKVGPDTGPVSLKLEPEAIISGTVVGEDDEPLEESYVDVLRWQTFDWRRRLVPVQRGVVTDDDGEFRLAGLPPGRYYLQVKPRGAARYVLGLPSAKPDQTYPLVSYFPSSTDAASATPVDLAPGQHLEVRFTLKLVPSFKVAGVIVNAGESKQVPGPTIVNEFGQVLQSPNRFDPQHGTFEFRDVPAGNYELQYGMVESDGKFLLTHQKISVQSNITNLRLAVSAGVEIPVNVRTDFTKPQGARGQCTQATHSGEIKTFDCSEFPAVRVELASLDFINVRFQSDGGPARGLLSVHKVTPGHYAVRVMPIFGGYVQSARCGNADLLREPLVVPESGSVPPIDVVLRDDSATLKIQVKTDQPGQQSTVLVFPDPLTPEPQARTILGAHGEFDPGPLAPGVYKIFAFDAADGMDSPDLEMLSRYASRAASVTVSASGSATVLVDVIHTGVGQ